MRRVLVFVWLLSFSSFLLVDSRALSCLDGCDCDQETRVISCSHGGRRQLRIPSEPLVDFHFIDLSCNDIKTLPAESLLLAAFPDLKGIDLEGNPNLNCSLFTTDDSYTTLATLNNCDGKPQKVPCEPLDDDTDCDWKCRGLKRLKEMWRVVKNTVREKYYELGADKLVDKVSSFFSNAFNNFSS